jgi:hypothetical protein
MKTAAVLTLSVLAVLSLAACGEKSAKQQAGASGGAPAASPMASASPAADPVAYAHAVDCTAATMTGRDVITAELKLDGKDPMQAFMAGPSWARHVHELALASGSTDAKAEADMTARLSAAAKTKLAGGKPFEDSFILACAKDAP